MNRLHNLNEGEVMERILKYVFYCSHYALSNWVVLSDMSDWQRKRIYYFQIHGICLIKRVWFAVFQVIDEWILYRCTLYIIWISMAILAAFIYWNFSFLYHSLRGPLSCECFNTFLNLAKLQWNQCLDNETTRTTELYNSQGKYFWRGRSLHHRPLTFRWCEKHQINNIDTGLWERGER